MFSVTYSSDSVNTRHSVKLKPIVGCIGFRLSSVLEVIVRLLLVVVARPFTAVVAINSVIISIVKTVGTHLGSSSHYSRKALMA